jgi:glycosyltransferase involved in cell wall biosynthesis
MSPAAGACDGLRILLVGTYPPPFGGIASHLTNLIPGLKARGAEDIAVLSFSSQDSVLEKDGFTLYRFNLKANARALLNPLNWGMVARTLSLLGPHHLGMKRLITECVKAVLIDRIATRHRSRVASFYQCDMNMQLLPLGRLWRDRRAIVLTVFGEIYEQVSAELIDKRRKLFRDLIALPVAVLSSSRHCACSFSAIGVTRPIEPVYYGVETENVVSSELRARFRAENGIRPDEIVVLFMGRLSKEMGVDVLLQAAAELLARNDAIRLVIAGARGEHSQQAEQLGAARKERVLVMQDVPFAKQAEIYSAADVFVAPSFNQRACMGMAIKEAMAAALPVIGGAGGGVPEAVVDGETGFLVPVGAGGAVDAAQFVDRVLRVANEPAMRALFGRAGRRRAEQLFSYETTNQRMAEVFMSARSMAKA